MWQLRDTVSGAVLRTFREGDRIRMGAAPDSDVHCDAAAGAAWELVADSGGMLISGAATGIEVNGRAAQLPMGVRSGDLLRVGGRTLRVELDPAATLIRDPRTWRLCGVSDQVAEVDVPLVDDLLVIGRDEDCDVVLDEGHVSRHHARLERAADGIWLTDLDSRNGTFVDGQRIRGARRLHGYVQLMFDETRFELRPEPVATAAEPVDPRATLIRPTAAAASTAGPPSTAPIAAPQQSDAALLAPAQPDPPSLPGTDAADPDVIATAVAPAAGPLTATDGATDLVAGRDTGSAEVTGAEARGQDVHATVVMPHAAKPATWAADRAAGRSAGTAPGPAPDQGTTAMTPAAAAVDPHGAAEDVAATRRVAALEPAPADADVDPAAATRVLPAQGPEGAPSTLAAPAATAPDELAPTVQIQRPLQPVLIGNRGPIHGDTFVLHRGTYIIGRGSDCDVVLPERSVSQRHARLVIRPDEYTVMNLTSSNGMFVNGERVTSKQLGTGDVISLGRIELIFAEDAAAAERTLKSLEAPPPLPNWAYVLVAFAATIGALGTGLWALRQFGP